MKTIPKLNEFLDVNARSYESQAKNLLEAKFQELPVMKDKIISVEVSASLETKSS